MAQLITLLYNITDRIYLGHIQGTGSLALPGAGICTPIILAVSALTELVEMGGAPRMSFFEGQGKRDKTEQTLGRCAAMLILIGAAVTAVLYFASANIVTILAEPNRQVHMRCNICGSFYGGSFFLSRPYSEKECF